VKVGEDLEIIEEMLFIWAAFATALRMPVFLKILDGVNGIVKSICIDLPCCPRS